MSPQDQYKLEASIHRVLRALPDRKAPFSLEGRVLAELSRRAALPWYRKSFAHWPSSVRGCFFVLAVAAAALVVAGLFVLGRTTGAGEITSGIATSRAWLVIARDVVVAAGFKVRAFLAEFPPLVLYGAAAALGLCYAAVAAAGAATFRALSPIRQA
jgi:hypothetical protein